MKSCHKQFPSLQRQCGVPNIKVHEAISDMSITYDDFFFLEKYTS